LNLSLHILRELICILAQNLFNRVNQLLTVVLNLSLFTTLLIFGGVLFSITNHTVDVFLRERASTGNGDLLLFSGSFIFRRNLHDTVSIDVEGYLNLWNTSRSRSDPAQ